jgi:hypothetical protein
VYFNVTKPSLFSSKLNISIKHFTIVC